MNNSTQTALEFNQPRFKDVSTFIDEWLSRLESGHYSQTSLEESLKNWRQLIIDCRHSTSDLGLRQMIRVNCLAKMVCNHQEHLDRAGSDLVWALKKLRQIPANKPPAQQTANGRLCLTWVQVNLLPKTRSQQPTKSLQLTG